MSKNKKDALPKPTGPGKGAPDPEVDPEFQGLMTEIEDDLREEELKKLWARFGTPFIAVLVVAILAVLGWQLWREKVDSDRQALARSYEQAIQLLTTGKTDEAITAYAAVAGRRGEGFAVLAQLQKAALLADKDDTAGALAAYQALGTDTSADPLFRDLAVVLYAMHGLDSEDPAALEAKLSPMLSRNNPYYYTGVELTALLAHKRGDSARAAALIEQLLSDPETPGGTRARADELLVMFSTAAAGAAPTPPPAPG